MGARLVRDYIAQIPWDREELKQHLRPVRDPQEHDALLRAKLLEEAAELNAATSREEMIEEVVDVMEVLDTFIDRYNLSRVEIVLAQAEKYGQRGGFLTGVVLET